MADLSNRIALVYDRVNKWGGAERVLLALHELFPQAPLYTAVYNPATAGWAKVFPQVIPTFLQSFPFAASHHELYPWLSPLAFETFNFDGYDMVISVTSADAKGIITKPSTFHLCYCLTPTRYLWSHGDLYQNQLNPVALRLARPLFNYLKYWDQIACRRPDAYIAISRTVRDRIKNFYGLESDVVYPPVDVENFSSPATDNYRLITDNYFLYVGRLVAYKRAQMVAQIFHDLKLPLVIIGAGALARRLNSLASPFIHYLGHVSDEILQAYYRHARAVVFFHEEDFGLVPVEAMATGTPVIGLARGGVSETVVHGVTGHLVEEDSLSALKDAILNFDPALFDAEVIRRHAQKFSKARFQKEFLSALTSQWKKYRTIFMS